MRELRAATEEARASSLSLAGVLIVAAALRFWALPHGIPYAVGADEPVILEKIVGMMRTGDFNPHFFDYPSLIFYLHLPFAVLRFLVGAMQGKWTALDEVGPADFYLWARAVTATLGTATVLLVGLVGARWGARHGLLAAALMALMPMHVRESHYALTDVPMTFLVALCWWLSLRAHERPLGPAFAVAGVTAGLAAATKYPGALALVMPLIVAVMTPEARPSRLVAALLSVAGAAIGFLLAAPYTVLDLPGFLNGFGYLASHYAGDAPHADPGWLIYLKHLRINLEWPAMLLLAGGIVLAIVRGVRGPGRVKWTLALVFPLLFFSMVANQRLIYARYLLPAVPFVCVLIGVAVVSGVSLLRRFQVARAIRTTFIAALTVTVLLPAALNSIGFVRDIGRPSTYDAAWHWMQTQLPDRAPIAIERYAMRVPEPRYAAHYVRGLTDESLAALRARNIRYLLATSQVYGVPLERPETNPELATAYRTLFRSTRELARFSPTPDRPGPEIRILALE